MPHKLQAGNAVHNRIAPPLIINDLVNQLLAHLPIQSHMLRARIGRVEIQGNLPNIRAGLGIFNGFRHSRIIQSVDCHINTKVRVAATGQVFLQPGKSALATNFVMPMAHAIQADPNGICPQPGKRPLSVSGHGGGVKAQLFTQIQQVVQIAALLVPPKGGLAALKIHKTRAQTVGIFQLLFNLLPAFADTASVSALSTMRTT